MSDTCEKCSEYNDTTDEFTILGIPCSLCNPCYRAWARRYNKNPDKVRFEILSERLNFLRSSSIGQPLGGSSPFAVIDLLVTEREAMELKLIEDTIDWLEEMI